jgi:glycosyltransferase involved in cell wall biosynthesis
LNPEISVLIACYNSEDFIAEAIESVLAQSFQDFEIIVVDDGSTDASLAAMSCISDPKLTIIKQENKGASSARNKAFAASTGTYVLYFDADDLMKSRHLECLLAGVQSSRDVVAFSPWVRFTKLPLPSFDQILPSHRDMSGPDWLVTEWRHARPMMQSGMFLIPRCLVDNYGGWCADLSLVDDFEFFGRILSKVKLMTFAPDAGLYYRSGIKNSLSKRRDPEAIKSALVSVKRATEHLLAETDTPESRLSCANCLQDFIFLVYPDYRAFRREVEHLVSKLGGSDLKPDGPPGFQSLQKVVGWKLARRVQRLAEYLHLNSSALDRHLNSIKASISL